MRPTQKTIDEALRVLKTMGVEPLTDCPRCGVPRHVLAWHREPEVADIAAIVSECASCGEVLRIEERRDDGPCEGSFVGPTFPFVGKL